MRGSGKLLIVSMVAIGLAAAGASWWFRYAATHRAAQFWGPAATRLIRDGPRVTLVKTGARVTNGSATAVDVSAARGLTHLRNALLVDRSFSWMGLKEWANDDQGGIGFWTLTFSDPDRSESLIIEFSEDCHFGTQRSGGVRPSRRYFSTAPIAGGLIEMFTEFSADPAGDGR